MYIVESEILPNNVLMLPLVRKVKSFACPYSIGTIQRLNPNANRIGWKTAAITIEA